MILMTPRLFPQKILDAKVFKTSSEPHVAVVIIKYRKGDHILTESFSSPIFNTGTPAKSNACRAACEYIIRNFMDELKQLDDETLMKDNGPDGDQYDDEDLNADNVIEGIPKGDPSVIKDGSFNSDEDTTSTHHLTTNQDEDRKRQYDADLANKVNNTSKDSFHKAEGSPILTKILKRN